MTKALLLTALALAVVPRTAPAQGVASSNAKPVKTVKSSGLPWDAKFTDIAAEAGLDLRFIWRFTPDEPWAAGRFNLAAAVYLEDLAGNSLERPFEVDIFEKVEDRIEHKQARIEFEVR